VTLLLTFLINIQSIILSCIFIFTFLVEELQLWQDTSTLSYIYRMVFGTSITHMVNDRVGFSFQLNCLDRLGFHSQIIHDFLVGLGNEKYLRKQAQWCLNYSFSQNPWSSSLFWIQIKFMKAFSSWFVALL
jgi:hypothetical protein